MLILIFADFFKPLTLRKMLLLSIPFYFLLWSVLLLFDVDSINNLTSFPALCAYFLFIILSMFHLTKISYQTEVLLLKNYEFWFCCGILVYFAGNILIFVLALIFSAEKLYSVWQIHSIIIIISNLVFTTSFLVYNKWSSEVIPK